MAIKERFEFTTQTPFRVTITGRKCPRLLGESKQKYLKRAARFARRVLKKLLNSWEYEDSHESFAVRDALLAAEFAFELGTFGVEHIRKGRGKNSPAFDYLNTGDPYDLTLLYIHGQFRIGTWGDIVERGNYD